MARKAVDEMVKHQKKIVVVSLTEDQAMLIIQMALSYAKEKYPTLIGKGRNKPTLKSITINKVKMISRPVGATGDSIRGFEGGILVIDEAARMPKMFWLAAMPIILTSAGQVWMCSTPFGKQGYFWERFNESYNLNEPKARFKVFYKSTPEVMNEREISLSWTKEQKEGALRILDEDKKAMSELEFGQEYLGLFLEDLQQYFSDELINKCCTRMRKGNLIGDIFMGVDIARLGGDDLAFEFVKAITETRFEHIENIVKRGQVTTRTEEDIIHFSEIYNPQKVGIDAGSGSLGVGIFDRLMENPKMKKKVVPMNNRSISLDRYGKSRQRIFKEDMYDNLKAMMEKGEIELLNDENLKVSLKSIQYEFKEEGIASKIRIFSSYGHIVEGLMRACWLAKKEKIKKLNISYI